METNQISKSDKKISKEILRFLVTGVVCSIADFIVCYLLTAILPIKEVWIETAISTLGGFIIGVICNYILSTFWVFKNVDKKSETKSKKFIIFFVLLSAIGWLISYLTMLGCTVGCQELFNIDIDNFDIASIFNLETWISLSFWLYIFSFGIKTLFGMIWNYLTRKFILYKAPKEEVTNE